MNLAEIKTALEDQWLTEHLEPLDPQRLDLEVREISRHAGMVNEIGRMILFDALRSGRIGIDEFKRRALKNDPSGQDDSRFRIFLSVTASTLR